MLGHRLPTSSLSALLARDLPDDAQTNRIWFGQYAIAAVLVAHRLELFDRCHPTGWTSINELSARLEVHPEALLRLCRVLHCRKLLEVDLEGRDVQLTAQSTIYWRKDSLLFRGSQLEEVRPENAGAAELPYHQARILKMLREGGDPARSAKGTFSEMWSEGAVDPDATLSYNEFMRTQSFSVAIRAARSGVYAGVEHFVDLGGGSAAFALVVKGVQPKTKCSIFDLPEVCDAAAAFLRGFPGVEVELLRGSFFDVSWPTEAPDCFNLSNILHDWCPDRCAGLLANAYEHLAPGGRLVITEVLLDEDGLGPEPAVVFDMLMYMNHAAQQLRLRELTRMTEGAGFVGLERIATSGDYSVLVAKKPLRH